MSTSAPILYLTNQYPAVTHTFIRREIHALERRGLTILRVAARAGPGLVDPVDISERSRTRYLLSSRAALLLAVIVSMLAHPGRFFGALGLTGRLLRRSDRPMVLHLIYFVEACLAARIARASGARHIHAHFGTNSAEVAMIAAHLASVTFSFTVHGYDEFDKPQFLGLGVKIRRASFVACVSFYGRAQLMRWCDQADAEKLVLVRCGLKSNYAEMDGTIERSGVPRFLCVGRLCREKAQDVLVKAAARLAHRGLNFEVVLVGDGEARTDLERLIEESQLGRIIHMTGWLSGDQVRKKMLSARALVVPSFAENLPVVIMEAMALARPVIATWIAGIPELAEPRVSGWLVPASSDEALADAMQACLERPDAELAAMGERARRRVALQHDVDREAEKLAALFT